MKHPCMLIRAIGTTVLGKPNNDETCRPRSEPPRIEIRACTHQSPLASGQA